MTKHYRYGGSSWARTIACPGWVKQSRHCVPRRSAAADRGTLLHAALQAMYTRKLKAELLVGFTTPEVADQSVSQADARSALIPAHGALTRFLGPAKPEFEKRVEHSELAGGTADVVASFRELGILGDAKFGEHKVKVNGNAQLLFYAAAVEWPKRVKDVVLGIIQPTHRPVLQTTTVKVSILKRYAESVHKVVEVAEGANPPLRSGAHCDYCPASVTCPEHNKGLSLFDPQRFATGFFSTPTRKG